MDNQANALQQRIRRFYEFLNRRQFESCYRMIDPKVVGRSDAVALTDYQQSLGRFLDQAGTINDAEIRITGMHLQEVTKLYEGRGFAQATTMWKDANGNDHEFSERWVLDGGDWYTRATGLVWSEPVTI